MSATLNELTQRVLAFVDARDWAQFHSPRNLAMALSVEANELLELYLWDTGDGQRARRASSPADVADEAADVLMCLLNFAHRSGIDLEAALLRKIDKTGEKYPVDKVKGKAFPYDGS